MTTAYTKLLDKVNWQRYEPAFLVIDITRKCTETCAHCVVESSPFRSESIKLDQMQIAVKEAKENGFASVSFYGGEPFVAKDLLFNGVKAVLDSQLVCQIMTNGFWGHTKGLANKTIDRLIEAHTVSKSSSPIFIGISTDEFHVKVKPRDIATILGEWLSRPDTLNTINVGLNVGNSGKGVNSIYNEIAAEFHKLYPNLSIWSSQHRSPDDLKFIDTTNTLKIKNANLLTGNELINILKETKFLEDPYIEALRQAANHNDTANFISEVLSYNEIAAIAWADDTLIVGKVLPHQVQTSSYTMLLTGAGRSMQDDNNWLNTISPTRLRSDKDLRSHELRSILILGSDGNYYLQPMQLNYKIEPLGGVGQTPIAEVIRQINDGEQSIARLIIDENFHPIRMAASIVNPDLTFRLERLYNAGLVNEAIIEGLLDKQVLMTLKSWGNFA